MRVMIDNVLRQGRCFACSEDSAAETERTVFMEGSPGGSPSTH